MKIHTTMQRFVMFVFIALAAAAGRAQNVTVPIEMVQYPDLIIYNGKIVTMDDVTPTGPPGTIVEAMAVKNDEIQFLGASQQLLRYAGPQTKKIDLKGRTVIPGMIDTHNHLHDGFISNWSRRNPQEVLRFRKSFNVTGKTFEDLTKGIELVLKEQMASAPQDQWATISLPGRGPSGLGIGTVYMTEKQMTREKLDALAPTRPVAVDTESAFLLNTAGRDAYMKLFDVPPTPENESSTLVNPQIGRTLITEQYFRTRVPQLADIIQNGLQHFSALGFTSFSSHIVGFPIHDAYMKLAREGRMPVRFGFAHRYCQVMAVDIGGCFERLGDMAGFGNDYFWNLGVTLGGLDSDAPGVCSTMETLPQIKAMEDCRFQPGTPYNDAIYKALRSHLRYVINHVMGDRSIDIFLDILERAMKDDPTIDLNYVRSLRITADHCGFYPRQDQLQRLVKYGFAFSCGPKEIDDMGSYIPKVYAERYAKQIEPIQSMLRAGLVVGNEGGGDGMADVNPTAFARFYPFITRKRPNGVLISPEEAVDRVQLLKMSTSFAANYMMKEKELGTLERGKKADFVVFNKDYFTVPEPEITSVFPLMVVTGGKVQVLREEYAKEIGMPAVGPQIKFSYDVPRANAQARATEEVDALEMLRTR
jgi:predicted amidohydrolase YtcJ